jgi:rare lipoprotein A
MLKGALLGAALACGLSACASVTPAPEGLAAAYRAPPAPGRAGGSAAGAPRYKLGAPYQSGGVWYVPAEQPNYDEVGLASWYGDAFNGKPTADGEIFDMEGISAAHATLPMPSIVEVTNLDNGRSIRVRLNDRGPFHPGRIIDLSRGGAKALGFYQKGTARVRVRFIGLAPLGGGATPETTVASIAPRPVIPLIPLDPPADVAGAPRLAASSAASGPTGYVVQIGAFSARANAERAAARLAGAGRTAIEPLRRNGGELYRVTLTGWRDAEAAAAARAQAAALGFSDARVIAGS